MKNRHGKPDHSFSQRIQMKLNMSCSKEFQIVFSYKLWGELGLKTWILKHRNKEERALELKKTVKFSSWPLSKLGQCISRWKKVAKKN